MSLVFQCGGTGSGKSYRTVENHIIPELVEGRRVVITNLPLKLPELAEFLAKTYPETFVDLRKRLIMLEDEDLAEFYRFRPYGYMVPPLSREDEKKGQRLRFMECVREDKSLDLEPEDFWNPKRFLPAEGTIPDVISSKALPGVLYVLDEVHTAYAAKDWQLHGNAVLFYLSQRRKFGGFADKVVCITQYPEQVMTDFRRHCQDWRYTTNHGKSPVTWGVKRPELMTEMRYLDIKRWNSSPIGMSKFKVDPDGIGSVYDTDAGVGVSGGGSADRDDKPKGLPWWTWVAAAACLALGLFFLPNLFGFGVRKLSDRTGGVSVVPVQTNAPAGAAAPGTAVPVLGQVIQQPIEQEESILGYSAVGTDWTIYTTDGNTFTTGHAEAYDTAKGLKFRGRWYGWAKPKRTPVAPVSASVAPIQQSSAAANQPVAAPGTSRESSAGTAQNASVLANPDAAGSEVRYYRILGFDGRTHALRRSDSSSQTIQSDATSHPAPRE